MKRNVIFKILFFLVMVIGVFSNITYANENQEQSNIRIEYQYNENTNQVTAKIISDTELMDTKPTWTLSDDKKIYTKLYTENQVYYTDVYDINGNKTVVEIKIELIQKTTIKMEYDFNKGTGQVVAKIVSNVELKDTKPTWKLSEDRKIYTKIYTENTEYTTPVQDKWGNIINVAININQLGKEKPNIQVTSETYSNKQIICRIVSDVPLKDTKPTWKLSEDRLVYTKEFSDNMDYYTLVEDIYGNIVNVNIKITAIDKTPPVITLEYKYNNDDTVTVYMKSNEQLGDTKPTWKLSDDKLTYEKTYSTAENYSTPVRDIYGNETSVKIDFKPKKLTYKQEDNSTIMVKYLYIDHKKAIVQIVSSIKMNDTKPTWKLSDDGYTYTKEYYANERYTTKIQDVNGVSKDVKIIVNIFDDYSLGIDVSRWQGKIDFDTLVESNQIDFMIARIGWYSTSQAKFIVDAQFERNYIEAKKRGIPIGGYLYSYAISVEEAIEEAEELVKYLKSTNQTNFDLPIFYDIENDNQISLGKETLTQMAIEFGKVLKREGYNVGVYSYSYWLNTYMDLDKIPSDYDIWVADFGKDNNGELPDDIYKYGQHEIWQYTETGKVDGISESVDMNICYKKYF